MKNKAWSASSLVRRWECESKTTHPRIICHCAAEGAAFFLFVDLASDDDGSRQGWAERNEGGGQFHISLEMFTISSTSSSAFNVGILEFVAHFFAIICYPTGTIIVALPAASCSYAQGLSDYMFHVQGHNSTRPTCVTTVNDAWRGRIMVAKFVVFHREFSFSIVGTKRILFLCGNTELLNK